VLPKTVGGQPFNLYIHTELPLQKGVLIWIVQKKGFWMILEIIGIVVTIISIIVTVVSILDTRKDKNKK